MSFTFFRKSKFDISELEKQVNELSILLSTGIKDMIICTYRNKERSQIMDILRQATGHRIRFHVINYDKSKDTFAELKNTYDYVKSWKLVKKNVLRERAVFCINGLEQLLTTESPPRLNVFQDLLVRRLDATILLWINDEYLPKLFTIENASKIMRTKIFRFRLQQEGKTPIIIISYVYNDKNFVWQLYSYLRNYKLIISLNETDSLFKNRSPPALRDSQSIFRDSSKSFVFVPILSSDYVNSNYCRKELTNIITQLTLNIYSRIIPILYKETEIPRGLQGFTYIDFTQGFQRGVNNFLNELELSPTERILYKEKVKGLADVWHQNREQIREISNSGQKTTGEAQINKPTSFMGEKTVLLGRDEDILKVEELLATSNIIKNRVCIVGPAGIGKSALAFKTMHKMEDRFDCIIPIYIQSHLSLSDLLVRIVESSGLELTKNEFVKKDCESQKDEIISALKKVSRTLIFLDGYEHIFCSLNNGIQADRNDDARQIHNFLEEVPENTSILLTSTVDISLDNENQIRLHGLNKGKGRDLFILLAKSHFGEKPSNEEDIKRIIEEISDKIVGHPLSIEILAGTYRGKGIVELNNMAEKLDRGLIDMKTSTERQALKTCLDYSMKTLDKNIGSSLLNLTFFKSPFPISKASEIFKINRIDILYLYELNIISRIDSDRYGDLEQNYWLYAFHPAIRENLEGMGKKNDADLESDYGEKFCRSYYELLTETYSILSKQLDDSALRRFNIMLAAKNNDFDRSIILTKNNNLKGDISRIIGSILQIQKKPQEAMRYHEQALAIHKERKDMASLAIDYSNIGTLYSDMGQLTKALDYHRKALAIHKERKDMASLAIDYSNIGRVLSSRGNRDEAMRYHEQALAIHKERKDMASLAIDYSNIGTLYSDMGQLTKALDYHRKALQYQMKAAYSNEKVSSKVEKEDLKQYADEQYSTSAIAQEVDDLLNPTTIKDEGDINGLKRKGISLYEGGRQHEALKYYTEALKRNRYDSSIWYHKGHVLSLIGEYEEAIKCFDEAIKLNPNFAYVWHDKGYVLSLVGRKEEAKECFRMAIKCYQNIITENPRDGTAWNYVGVAHDDLEEYEDAIKCFDKAIELDGNNAEAYHNKGYSLGNQRNYEQAIKCFDKAIELNPNFADSWRNKGYVLNSLGIRDEDIKCFDKAIEIDPYSPYARNSKGYVLNSLLEYHKAIECFDKAIELNPNFAYAWYNKGYALYSLAKYEEAIDCIERSIKINPKNVYPWNYKGYALNNLREYEDAIESFSKSIELNPENADAWNGIGYALNNLREYEGAIKCFDKAVELNQENADAHRNKGYALRLRGEKEEAKECFRMAIKCYQNIITENPRDGTAWNDKGVTHDDLEEYEDAIKCFDKAIDLNPNQKFVDAYRNKGYSLGNLKKYEEAIKCFDKAIDLNPNFADSWRNKGYALGQLARTKEAMQCFDKATNLDVTFPYGWNSKGYYLLFSSSGEYEEAIKCFDKAIKFDPKFAYAWYNKGYALSLIGEYEEAIKCFDKAIELDEKFAYAWYNKGYTLLDPLRKYEEAIKCFDKAIELHDESVELWNVSNSKGVAFLQLKSIDKAIECFDEAIKFDPKFFDAWYNKAYALRLVGRKEEAKESIIEARNINPYFDIMDIYQKASTFLESRLRKKKASTLSNQEIEESIRIKNEKKMSLSHPTPLKSLTLSHPMPFKYPLQSFRMPLKYPLYAGRMPLKYIRMPVKYMKM